MNDPDRFAELIRFTRLNAGRYSHWSSVSSRLGVNKERGPPDVARIVENEQALVPLVGHFQDPKREVGDGFPVPAGCAGP